MSYGKIDPKIREAVLGPDAAEMRRAAADLAARIDRLEQTVKAMEMQLPNALKGQWLWMVRPL